MSYKWCSKTSEGIRLAVRIMPNSKKNEIIGTLNNMLKIRLQAQPIEGKANEALIRYIAEALEVPKSKVFIMHGHTSKQKILEVHTCNLSIDAASKMLLPS